MKRHYFVDYEVYSCGTPARYGQRAVTWEGENFDPDRFLRQIRQQEAARHGVEPEEVRVRHLSRM